MNSVTVTHDYKITLPKELREAMHLYPGQKFELIPMGSVIQMVPKKSIEELKSSIAEGITSGQERPADEVFNRLATKYYNLAKE